MILVDTSVWIDYFRHGNDDLAGLLSANLVLAHPFVIGELACGQIRNREEILDDLGRLPQAVVASDSEAIGFISTHQLMGRGAGYLDIHLLASVQLTPDATLWTRDKKLAAIASHLSISH